MFALETERLLLRDFDPTDFEALYATTADPEYRRFYGEREMRRPFWQDIFNNILASANATSRDGYQLAVCLKSGQLIGTCGVRLEIPEDQQASFGCAIDRSFWGKGYAYEASAGLIDYGFSRLSIHRLYAETISENSRARKLLERLGMRLEGILRQNRGFRGRWWDTAVYAILAEEWLDIGLGARTKHGKL